MTRLRISKFRLLFVLIFPMSLWGKEFPMLHFTNETGLPSNTVYSIYRDSQDFLWMATDQGIVKYDGIEFEKFTTNDGLPCNEVFLFQEDREGRLWMGTYNGELCYYKDGVFHTPANTPFLRVNIGHSFADRLELENDGTITVWFHDHAHFVNIRGNKCNVYPSNIDPVKDNDPQKFLVKLAENRYLYHSWIQSFIIDTSNNVIQTINHRNNDFYTFSRDGQRRNLVSENGIFSTDEDLLLPFTNRRLAHSWVNQVSLYDNDWYICTDGGLYINNDLQILPGENISCVARDIEGNFWISTLTNGIYYLGKTYECTRKYSNQYKGQIKYAAANSDALYFFTDARCLYTLKGDTSRLVFDCDKNFVRSITDKNVQGFYQNSYNSANYLGSANIFYNVDKYVSYTISGINTSRPTAKVLKVTYDQKELEGYNPNFKEMFINRDVAYFRNNRFVSLIEGLAQESHGSEKMIILDTTSKDHRIYCMALSSDNSLWYSSSDHVSQASNNVSRRQVQFGKMVFQSMQFAGDRLVGISTRNQLVICKNPAIENLSLQFAEDQHVIWNKLYKLNDSLLLASTNDLYRLISLNPRDANPGFNVKIIENESLPLQADYICSNDSLCYFFKNGSITMVAIANLLVHHGVPKIFFKFLRTRMGNYTIRDGMMIDYNESKNINISFSPYCFGSRHLICEYSVSKDNADYWRLLVNHEINLFDAGFGNYVVKLRAKTLSGEFSAPFTFRFTITKPFWATWWFITLTCVCIITSILLIIRNKQKQMEKEKRYLEKELSTLRLQMNPHFLFNTLNSIYSLARLRSEKTPDMVHKLSEMLRYMTYKASQPLTTIGEEVLIIENYISLQKVRFENRLTIKKHITVNDPDTLIVPMLLLPIIENAYKHGIGMESDQSFINITLTLEHKMLTLFIANSIASESVKSSDNAGLGLTNTRRQLELLYREHALTTTSNNGTFEAKLMINIDSYANLKLPHRRR